MRLNEFQTVDINKLDDYLAKLCAMVKKGQADRPEYYGMVAAGILTPKGRWVAKLNYPKGKLRVHAERAAIEEYTQYHGNIPKGSIMITTLSPCNEKDDETAEHRVGMSCTDLINHHGFKHVYCGFKDPTQDEEHGTYKEVVTKNKQLGTMCKEFADTFLDKLNESFDAVMFKHPHRVDRWNPRIQFNWNSTLGRSFVAFNKHGDKWVPVDDESARYIDIFHNELEKLKENFADGRHPEDKGDSARYGIPKHASISSLRKMGHGSGRKAQLARWQANMRSGRNK